MVQEDLSYHEPDKKQYHSCIVNLVIGWEHSLHIHLSYSLTFMSFLFSTLYCAKGNYEFGITRVLKSLEPYNKKVIIY